VARRLLQIDFPMDGPWGEEMATAYGKLAETIAETPGLVWKIWTENAETGEGGGIYLFEDQTSLERYLEEHTKRLESFGVADIRAKTFDVNDGLDRITRAPI
jgi:hypothetical protein